MRSIIDDMVTEIKRMDMNVYRITEILNGATRTLRLNISPVSRSITQVA